MNEAKHKRLIIFEDMQSAAKALIYARSNGGTPVAFSVPAKLLFEKAGVRCSYPDELVELPDLNRIGTENIERVRQVCAFLDREVRVQLAGAGELSVFSAASFSVKIFFDSIYTSYDILQRLIDRASPDEIIVFRSAYDLWRLPDPQCAATPAIVASLLENVLTKKGMRIKTLPVTGPARRLAAHMSAWKRGAAGHLSHFRPRQKTGSSVINLCNSHDMPYLCDRVLSSTSAYSLSINGMPLVPHCTDLLDIRVRASARSRKEVAESLARVFRAARASGEYRALFTGDDDLFEFMNRCLEIYAVRMLEDVVPNADRIRRRILSVSPALAVTSQCRMTMRSAFIFELVRSLGLPIVSYQEGGGGGYLNWPPFNLDAELADYFLVYGRGVAESPFIKGRARTVPVGSLRLEAIHKGLRHGRAHTGKIYVVLDVIKYNTYQHYPFNGGFFSRAFSHQLSILDTLRRFDGVQFVIKTVRSKKSFYLQCLSDNMTLETAPLDRILDDASAFILDSATTALQECLLTDRPIALLYGDDAQSFDASALELLRKRVRVCSDPRFYGEAIRALISDVERGTEMVKEREFLDEYCLMENTEERLKEFFDTLSGIKR